MTAIRADHLSKNYKLRRERTRTLKETVLRQYAPAEQVQALSDVSFAVQPGESFGVVGANGSGKSTLLKLLAGTAKPTAGTLEVTGRVTALLEIGAEDSSARLFPQPTQAELPRAAYVSHRPQTMPISKFMTAARRDYQI